MAKRSKEEKKNFESCQLGNSKERFTRIFASMEDSPAYLDLDPYQRELYRACKRQYRGDKVISEPGSQCEEYADSRYFYCNAAYVRSRHIYGSDAIQKRRLPKDLQELGKHGFIELASDGEKTKSKSIYKFSPMWSSWQPGDDFISEGYVTWNKTIDKGNVSMGGGRQIKPFN